MNQGIPGETHLASLSRLTPNSNLRADFLGTLLHNVQPEVVGERGAGVKTSTIVLHPHLDRVRAAF